MRIVHILLGKASPNTLNGVNKALHGMATAQAELGHQVEVWGLSASMRVPDHPRAYKLRIFPVTGIRVTLGPEIRSALSQLEAGTWVHFHSVFVPEFASIAHILKKHGIAYGITPHRGYAAGVLRKNPWKKRLYIALREARYLRGAAWVQAIVESEVQDVVKIAPHAHIVLIPHGQEPLAATCDAEAAKAERPLIGFCARLTMHIKGLDYLIDGFAAFKAKGGEGELWLIGDGEDRAQLEKRVVESGAQPYVRFLGTRLGEEKLNLIACFDAFILNSRWEGLPMGCLEAAALGKPLLVSRETNLGEFVERNGAGLVLDETSAAGVTRVLQRVGELYKNDRLQQMGESARSLIEKEFSWEENASKFIAAITATNHAV